MLDTVRLLFAGSDFRKLFSGQLVSGLGDWLATFAFISLVYALTGQATTVALVLIVRLVPPMLAAPVGGVLADRLPRQAIMIAADLLRAGIILLVPFANLWQVYVLAFVHECVSLFFLPARDASVPQLAAPGALELANGLIMVTAYASLPLAGSLFGVLQAAAAQYPAVLPFAVTFHARPEALAFVADGVSFLVSAGFIAAMRFRGEAGRLRRRPRRTFTEDFVGGFRAIWAKPGLRRLAYGIALAMFGGGVLFAVGIGYVRQTLGQSSAAFGWLASLWGGGMALGLTGIRWLLGRRGRLYIFALAVLAMGGIIISMAVVPLTVLAFALAVPFGVAFATALTLATTIAQAGADTGNRGTAMGGFEMLYNIGLGSGALSIGLVATAVPAVHIYRWSFDGNQLGMLLAGVIICSGAAAALRPGRRVPEKAGPAREPAES